MMDALLPVVNPLGDAPEFLALTPGCDEPTRADLASRIPVCSFFPLPGTRLFGPFVLLQPGLSIPVVHVGGGAVVRALGWKLLAGNPIPTDVVLAAIRANATARQRAVAPSTMPRTIDAGAISAASTVGANHAHPFSKSPSRGTVPVAAR